MRKIEIKKGDKYNMLTIVKEIARISSDHRRFLCRCVCGKTTEVNLLKLRGGFTKSCGCWRKEMIGKLCVGR